MPIPVIDIFAGPGGLGEGFSALRDENGSPVFKIALSVEKDPIAHETLTLRSFFRQFTDNIPDDYYEFLKGNITQKELFKLWPEQAIAAKEEAWQATLGKVSKNKVDRKIRRALNGRTDWLLIGGPPCQAYSIVGRSRRQETVLDGRKDKRVGLYKQYLRILAIHNPAYFVMENVKGLLSAETNSSPIFPKILKDLSNPVATYLSDFGQNGRQLTCPGYKIYSLTQNPKSFDENGNPVYNQKDFVIRSEKYGIPQTRHRVILLGIRNDLTVVPGILSEKDEVPISKVLNGLPRLRSGLSKRSDSNEFWEEVVAQILDNRILNGADRVVKNRIRDTVEEITAPQKGKGAEYIEYDTAVDYKSGWFLDNRIGGVCNHISRGHMDSDIFRYMFVSCFAKIHRRSPKLEDFPVGLLPDHENVKEGVDERKFADRFRVQLWNKPAKTVTSHISKDGHYYIHPDPTQCRSFTVREAARIQTFPDNYFFCGPRTEQFHQVGNAVPPLLANSIAKILFRAIIRNHERSREHTERLQNV